MGKRKANGKGMIWKFFWVVMAVCVFTMAGSIVHPGTVCAAGGRRIEIKGENGKYLEKVKKNWFLRNQDGSAPGRGRILYLGTKNGKGIFQKGYYFFDRKGRLHREKALHKLEKQRTGQKKWKGIYYFGAGGRLYMKKGWVRIGKQKYFLNHMGRICTNCWVSGYYLQKNGTIARSRKVPGGCYVGRDGRKCRKEEEALAGLKKQVESIVQGYGGVWSVYVKNLKTGDLMVLNNRVMYPASTIKAFVMASVYNEIYHKRMQESSTVQRLLTNMITVSDNESFNELVRSQSRSHDFVSGAAVVNRYLRENGYSSTGCHHTLHPSSSPRQGDGTSNSSSVRDCGILLERIYKGKCVSSGYSKKMLHLLLNQQIRWKIPSGLPSGIKSANKTGETDAVQHDMAIVYGKKTDYVICIFSSGCPEYAALTGIRNISSLVYRYLN